MDKKMAVNQKEYEIIKLLGKGKPANKKSSPKQDLTKGNFAGSR